MHENKNSSKNLHVWARCNTSQLNSPPKEIDRHTAFTACQAEVGCP